MNLVKSILSDIKNKNLKPIYFLMGEEPYYIDKISEYIEKNVLTETEKEFNQTIVYGKDISIEEIISFAKRYPIMGKYQVVLIKEAQNLSRNIEKLVSYAQSPQLTTILVFNYKYKKLDKRKKIYKIIEKNGCIFESKKLYENQVLDWICSVLEEKGYKIELKSSQMLVEFLGTDLNKISKELEKLIGILPKNLLISPYHIEEYIGISKEFNNFELRKSIGEKNIFKSNQIINYFSENQKNNPLVMTISSLYSFFTQLLLYHGLKDKSKISVSKNLGIHPYFVGDYIIASKNYSMRKVSQIIAFLRIADLKSKGVKASSISQGDILRELVFNILH